ncbi:MAG: hypothetical protein COA42_18555, partial [Alteromonadaceae bacterium]
EVLHVNHYPADTLLQQAQVVVSAAGFNIVEQMRGSGKTHWVLPMDRHYDDQFLRAKNYRIQVVGYA